MSDPAANLMVVAGRSVTHGERFARESPAQLGASRVAFQIYPFKHTNIYVLSLQ
jgi:hypothetical protein